MAVKTVQYIFNGQTYNLSLNQGNGRYEATITAPSKSSFGQPGNKYGGTIKATDNAGNSVTVNESDSKIGESLKIRVIEKTAPIITITYPMASGVLSNNKPTITWKVTDNDSGVNPSTIGITIDSGNKITGDSIKKTQISGGYECSYTPATALLDGQHTVRVDATDNDGNKATQKSVTFKVDTVPPTLNVTSPQNDIVTNNQNITLSGTTNDVTSSPVTLAYKLNGGSEIPVTVQANGAFSTTIKANVGNNSLAVIARDSAGKVTTITRTFQVDVSAPVVQSIKVTPNPVDSGATFVISVEVTD